MLVERFFADRGRRDFCGQQPFTLQNVSRGINMASNSAGNVLMEILGRIDELSAAIKQNGSSLSSGTTSQST